MVDLRTDTNNAYSEAVNPREYTPINSSSASVRLEYIHNICMCVCVCFIFTSTTEKQYIWV